MSLEGHRGGKTFDVYRDLDRLNAQHKRVYWAMADNQWHTLAGISRITGDPEASISARLRDFRKKQFGWHIVLRSHIEHGLWEYRLYWNPNVAVPEKDLLQEAMFNVENIIGVEDIG